MDGTRMGKHVNHFDTRSGRLIRRDGRLAPRTPRSLRRRNPDKHDHTRRANPARRHPDNTNRRHLFNHTMGQQRRSNRNGNLQRTGNADKHGPGHGLAILVGNRSSMGNGNVGFDNTRHHASPELRQQRGRLHAAGGVEPI